MIRVAVVDDHPVVREGLASALAGESDLTIVGAVGSAEELITRAATWRPDVVLLDFEMPGLSGTRALRAILDAANGVRAIVFTAYSDDDKVVGAVRAGASGYLLKGVPATDIVQAIRTVHAGQTYIPSTIAAALAREVRKPNDVALTTREREVLRMVADGLSNKQIARRLRISERTIKFHVNSVMTKLGAENRAKAAAVAIRRRLL